MHKAPILGASQCSAVSSLDHHGSLQPTHTRAWRTGAPTPQRALTSATLTEHQRVGIYIRWPRSTAVSWPTWLACEPSGPVWTTPPEMTLETENGRRTTWYHLASSVLSLVDTARAVWDQWRLCDMAGGLAFQPTRPTSMFTHAHV